MKHDLIDCNFKDIEIIVTKNNCYCEVNTFKHFILDKLGTDDSLIFFGHTKGLMNVIDGINYVDNILHWVYTMYYFNLEDEYVSDVEKHLIYSYGGAQKTFYGTLREYLSENNSSIYPGTFYWINPMKLYEDNINNRIRIPNIYNRNFCEELPLIYKDDNDAYNGLSSYNNYGMNCYLYNDNDWDYISSFLSDGNNNKYMYMYDSIMSEIGNEK